MKYIDDKKRSRNFHDPTKNSEYDQEIPKITNCRQTCGIMRKSETSGRQTKQSKQLSYTIEMIAKLELTQSNAQQIIEKIQKPTMVVTIKTNQQLPDHRFRKDSSQSHWGLKCSLLIPSL